MKSRFMLILAALTFTAVSVSAQNTKMAEKKVENKTCTSCEDKKGDKSMDKKDKKEWKEGKKEMKDSLKMKSDPGKEMKEAKEMKKTMEKK